MPDAQGVHMSDAQCRPMSLMLSMPQCLHIHSLPLILNLQKFTVNEWIKYNKYKHSFSALHNAVKCAKCGSNDSRAEISVKSLFVTIVREQYYFLWAVCTCVICLYIRPVVCIVTAEI